MLMTDPWQAAKEFPIPEDDARRPRSALDSPRGRLLIASCRSGASLARRVVERYRSQLANSEAADRVLFLPDLDGQFSDTETHVRLEVDVSGDDVYLFQALYDPTVPRSVDENYMGLLIAARAFREWGANHITAVLPYLAYARQDKPTRFQREPTTARLLADLSVAAGIDRLVTWHPHSPQIRGFYDGVPVDAIEALGLFTEEFGRFRGRGDALVVAPDVGAVKFVTYLSQALDLPYALATKFRPGPEEAEVSQLIGDFTDKRVAILVDDLISSGGTLEALARRLVEDKGIGEIYVGASHNLCLERAYQRVQALHTDGRLQAVVVTDSIPQTEAFQQLPFFSIRSLADRISRIINRIHHNRPVADLIDQAAQRAS
jgi:ribose-phosphate pyrophosphokinase